MTIPTIKVETKTTVDIQPFRLEHMRSVENGSFGPGWKTHLYEAITDYGDKAAHVYVIANLADDGCTMSIVQITADRNEADLAFKEELRIQRSFECKSRR